MVVLHSEENTRSLLVVALTFSACFFLSFNEGGENFGAALDKIRRKISTKIRPYIRLASKKTKVHSGYQNEDGSSGHIDWQLPIWVIARLKIKLERARHAILARNEVCQM